MAAVFRWSSCQADFYSSESESDSDDFEFGDEELEFDDVARVLVVEDEEPDKHKRWSEFEAIKLLRENKWNIDETVTEMLQEATHDSLNHLSSQGDEAKNRKVTNMKRKLRKLKTKLLKFNIVAQEKQGGEEFFAASQDSFVDYIKDEVNTKKEDSFSEDFEFEEDFREGEQILVEKKYRKAFYDVNNEHKRLRTDEIMDLVEKHAARQQMTTNKLLLYLLYRKNCINDKKFAYEMLRHYKGKVETTEIPTMKAIAIASIGNLEEQLTTISEEC